VTNLTIARRPRLWSAFVVVQVLAIAAVAVIAGFVWVNAIRTLTNPVKVPPPLGTPQSLVWNDRVFTSRASLAAYLRHRGFSYEAWARKHPEAASVVEHRPVVVTARRSTSKTTEAHAQAAVTTTKEEKRRIESAPIAKRAAPPPNSGDGGGNSLSLSALGWLLALFLGAVALAPARVFARFGGLRAGPSFRTYLGAAAATIVVAMLLAGVSG
jgi:hypothetical protein